MKSGNLINTFAPVIGTLCLAANLIAQTPCPDVEILATGLLGPSKIIQTPSGNFIVTESGPEVPNNGRVSIVDSQGNRRTLLDGLPSARTFVGGFNGTTGVYLQGRMLYVLNGQGDVALPGPVQGTERANPTPASPIFSSILAIELPEALETATTGFNLSLADHQALKSGASHTITNGSGESMTIRLVADFQDYAPDPRPNFADNIRHSHPYGIVAGDEHLYVIDAGFNNVRKVEIATGTEQTLASFPPTPSPLPTGPPVIENVPTSIHWVGGQLLVTTFGGAPFLPGYSKVHQIDSETGATVSVAEGLTTAIDATALSPSDLMAGFLTLEYNLSYPQQGTGKLRHFPTLASTPVTISACLTTPSSMLLDATSGRLILSELSTGHLVSLEVPESLPPGDTWTRKADMPTPRLGLSTCVENGKIYAIGGFQQVGASGMKTVEEYDPARDSWTTRRDMPTARLWAACAAVDGKIYVIGGAPVIGSPLKTIEEYDPVMDTWVRKTDMPTARSGCAAGVVNGIIYVIGGLTTFGGTPLNTVEAYDPTTDTWEKKAAMPTRRGLLSVVVVDGNIFAIGSSGPPSGPWLPTVEVYDPVSDTWVRQTDMPTARGAAGAVAVDQRIYVLGGRNGSTSFATVEELDVLTNTWSKRANMSTDPANTARLWNLSASAVNQRIYAIGGALTTVRPHPGSSLVLEYTPPRIAPEVTTPAPPEIVWPTPGSIMYGTAITADQLNAQVDGEIDGTFSYTPALGGILEAGQHTLAVRFEPANPAHGQPVSATVEITVNPVPLTIRAEDAQRPAGVANPALTVLYLGFVNGDTEEDLDVSASVDTSGTIDSPPGIYPILVSAAADGNYAITFENGVLTVEAPVPSGLPELSLSRHAGTLDFSWTEVAKTGLWRSVNLMEWTAVDGAVAENGVTRVTLTLDDLASLHGTQFFRLQRSE